MRKWAFASAAVLALGLLAGSGQFLVSQTKDPVKAAPPADAPPAAAAAAVAPAGAKSRIVKVTVYPSNALVTREVEVPAGKGVTELVVPEMPVQIVKDSLYAEGANGVRVLSTRFRSRPVLEDTREDVRKLEDEQKKLQIAARKLQSEMDTIKENMATLTKLERFTEATAAHAPEKGGVNGDAAITMAKYIMEQRAEKKKDLVALAEQMDVNKEQAAFAAAKLKDLTRGSTRVERDAVLVVDRENGAAGKVRLNYLVNEVSWQPQYKLWAGGAGKDAVQVDYLAGLKQHTGEDWTSVDLTLSTAQPMLNAAPPDLKRLEVTVVARGSLPPLAQGGGGFGGRGGLVGGPLPPEAFAPQPPMDLAKKAVVLRNQAVQAYNNFDLLNATQQLNDAAAFEQQRDLMKSRAELIAENNKNPGRGPGPGPGAASDGPSVTYHLKSRLSIPSRNDEQVIEVAKISLEPKYYYKTVPILNRNVYRLADLTNTSGHVLLPGEATMYQGTDFVGRMTMPLVAVGEEFTAGFGVDPQLQVRRQMMDKSKATQGGNQVLKYEYRILVSSYKKEPVQLQVWDRLPHAESETAGVTLVKASPALSKDALYERENRPSNLLRWDLEVEPAMNGERALAINYEVRLELDRNLAISGLLSR